MFKLLAWVLVKFRFVVIYLSIHHPYYHLRGYMMRYWLFNGYGTEHIPKYPWIPFSIRIHHILKPDPDAHLHDHPCNARSFILQGSYVEERGDNNLYLHKEGDTTTFKFGEYHRIVDVSDGGVWTLFILGRYQGTWGFLVNGQKIPWREYLNEPVNENSDKTT